MAMQVYCDNLAFLRCYEQPGYRKQGNGGFLITVSVAAQIITVGVCRRFPYSKQVPSYAHWIIGKEDISAF